MHVLVLAVGDRFTGSTQYRVAQYETFLAEQGMSLTYVQRDDIDASTVEAARQCDVLLNQKCTIRVDLAKKLIAASKRVVFDFDDAIYTRPGRPHSAVTQFKVNRRLQLWLKSADEVTPANEYLANYARRFSKCVKVIPMALDLQEWHPSEEINDDGVVIGWAGSPGNLPNLERLDSVLVEVLKQCPASKLLVFCGEKPKLSCPFEHHPFVPGAEPDFARRLDIGLLPLVDEEHARGKSPIKAIQYISSGVPAVGNVVGATAEILTPAHSIAVTSDTEWVNALTTLVNDRSRAKEMGKAGRQHAEANFDLQCCRQMLLDSLKGDESTPWHGKVTP